jgi:hypothetical protein
MAVKDDPSGKGTMPSFHAEVARPFGGIAIKGPLCFCGWVYGTV